MAVTERNIIISESGTPVPVMVNGREVQCAFLVSANHFERMNKKQIDIPPIHSVESDLKISKFRSLIGNFKMIASRPFKPFGPLLRKMLTVENGQSNGDSHGE